MSRQLHSLLLLVMMILANLIHLTFAEQRWHHCQQHTGFLAEPGSLFVLTG
jgi:hypothetical protein